MILMNHEERTPMKKLKTLFTSAIKLLLSLAIAILLIALLGNAISMAFYTLFITVSLGGLAYLFLRSPN
jgi:ABC-type uncharacterized transport system permease subunit|tara:strand:+ start:364 stop:570 length:207 start_codon:yes stop_codon:yes gene_type:complete